MADPIALDPADFWELQTIVTRLRSLDLERAAFLADHATRAAAADARRTALLTRLQARYPALADTSIVYRPDEDTCTLIPQSNGGGPPP
jgi:hypothetical protein